VWSLVSAVGIFCLGAGLTCAHGLNALMAPPPHLDNLGYGLAGAPPGPAGARGPASARPPHASSCQAGRKTGIPAPAHARATAPAPCGNE
jgi:hypothetical protein